LPTSLSRLARGQPPAAPPWPLAGAGFGLLALGVVRVPDPRGQAFIIVGVVLTVIGNLAQQRITRRLTGRSGR
jgi:hypothetical protein